MANSKKNKEKDIDSKVEKEVKDDAVAFEFKGDKTVESDDKYNSLLNQYARLQADFDNFKKRNSANAAYMYSEGVNDVLKSILPTIDSLDLAIKSQKDDKQKEGLEMVKKVFIDTLVKNYKIEVMESKGEEFDPNKHEAVMNRDDAENAGKVVDVLKEGYSREGKVLRHALVVVGQ